MDRRTLLRSAAWMGGALAAQPLLSACGNGSDSRASGRGHGAGPIAAAGLVVSEVPRREAGSAHLGDVATSVREFAADLYAHIASSDGNLVCSPYSVAAALAMTRVGALGRTAAEMDAVLRAGPQAQFNDGMNALSAHIDGLAGEQTRADGSDATIALDSANSLWGQRGVSWEEAFLDTLARDYGAGMRIVDYIRQTEASRTQINAWTSEQTHGRIPEIIPDGVLDQLTRLVLVNAIYLKAPWESPFEDSLTKTRKFTRSDGSRVDVDMMSGALEQAAYGRVDGCQVARLPYAGGGVAMSILLPDDDLAGFESRLTGDGLTAMLAVARPTGSLAVELPKWKFRIATALNDQLIAMGMPTAFDATAADFDGMTADADLSIAAVLHDAFIAVDEDGTEAAAATAVVMRVTSAMVPTATIVADRPFLFVIHDTETATPLFMGRVSDPTA